MATDQGPLFGDWSALRPCTDDDQLHRERKKAGLLAIREVYAGLIARGRAQAATEAARPLRSSKKPAAEAVEAAERDACATLAPQQVPARRARGPTVLQALDECLTPASAQTLPAPGVDRRRKSRLGPRASGAHELSPGSGTSAEPAAALTAQGLRLGPKVDSSSEFLRKHISLARPQQQLEQQHEGRQPGGLPLLPPPQQQQQQQPGGRPRQGRQWRPQAAIAQVLRRGKARKQGRSGCAGSSLESSGSLGSSPFSHDPFGSAPFDAFPVPPPPRLSRFGTTSAAVNALMQRAGSPGAVGGTAASEPLRAAANTGLRGRRQQVKEQEGWQQEQQQQQGGSQMQEAICGPTQSGRPRDDCTAIAASPTAAMLGTSQATQQQRRRQGQQWQPEEPLGGSHPRPASDHPQTAISGRMAAGHAGMQPAASQQQQQEEQLMAGQRELELQQQEALPGSQQQQQEEEALALDDCTLPPPNLPAPVAFGSFTEAAIAAALHPPFALPGAGQRSMRCEPGQQDGGMPAGSVKNGQDAAGSGGAATASQVAVPSLEQQQQLGDGAVPDAGEPASQHRPQGQQQCQPLQLQQSTQQQQQASQQLPQQQQGTSQQQQQSAQEQQPASQQPSQQPPQQQQQQVSQQQQDVVVGSPLPQAGDLPPESSPPFSWRLSPLPPSVAAEIAAAGAFTPSFHLHPLAAGEPGLRSSAGRGGGPAGAKPLWDSVPPTPAGLLDFTETVAEELGGGEACAETPGTAATEQQQQQQQKGHWRVWAAVDGQFVAETPAQPSLAQPSAMLQSGPAQDAAQRQQQQRQGGQEAAQLPEQPDLQEHWQQQPCLGGPPDARDKQQQCPLAAAHGVSPLPAPCGAPAVAQHCQLSQAAGGPALAASPGVAGAILEGLVLGTQLRLPTPALLAVATPDGQYAAVLLGSYAQYEPTEVVVLQLGGSGMDEDAVPEQEGAGRQQKGKGSRKQAAVAGPSPGRVRVVASVAVRLSSDRPGWPLNSNSFQLALDDRGDPLLLLSAALEPEDLPTHATRAISIISCAAGAPRLIMEIETQEPAWTLLCKDERTFFAGGQSGAVQPCTLDVPLGRYTWSKQLQTAVYHGYELNDLAQLSLAPGRPTELAGVSSDGVIAFWDLSSHSLLAVHSSYNYRIQQPQLVSWEQLAAATRRPPAAAARKGGPRTLLAQLMPRVLGSEGEEGVLGAVVATASRLTVGPTTVRIEGLTTSVVCGGLCLAGTQKGLVHVWDLRTGARQVVDAMGGQRITSIRDLGPTAAAAAGGAAAAPEAGLGPPGSRPLAGQDAGGEAAAVGEELATGGFEEGIGWGRRALVTGAGGHCLILELGVLQDGAAADG